MHFPAMTNKSRLINSPHLRNSNVFILLSFMIEENAVDKCLTGGRNFFVEK
jgi:hypothetical protein